MRTFDLLIPNSVINDNFLSVTVDIVQSFVVYTIREHGYKVNYISALFVFSANN
jgi:hypothetical protein